MNLETKITIYKFTPQVFTLTPHFPGHGSRGSLSPEHPAARHLIALEILIFCK